MKHFNEITNEFKSDLFKRIDQAESIVISSHISPDDDSISSVLAIYYYLTEIKGKNKVNIIYTGTQINNWEYFLNFDQIVFVEDLAAHVKDIDLLILVDGSGWGRFSREKMPENLHGKVVCLDHHPNPEDLFDLHLVATQYPAAAEIVYRIFFENEKLNKDICETLLLGITGDTGNFRYLKSDQADTILIAHKLVSEGEVYLDDLKTKYENMEEKVFKALAEYMKNSEILEIDGWPKFMVTHVDQDYVSEHDLDDNQVKEASASFTQYLRYIKGVTWGFILTPRSDGATHISFRSSPGSVNVNKIATAFGGGGHVRASGGKVENQNVVSAKAAIIEWMKSNPPVLE